VPIFFGRDAVAAAKDLSAKVPSDQYSEQEAAARRDATIRRMIAMPPKPHSEIKIGKKSAKKRVTKKK
jgi:hypothetical protein